jgi:DNA-binding transcriptional regulator YiaG
MNNQASCVKSKARPYPRRCAVCGEVSVSRCHIPYNAEVRHDGKLHAFSIASLGIDQCERCGEQFFTTSTDEEINLALRSHLGLLAPAEIRAGLDLYDVNQKEFAEHLGIAAETVSRWLTGASIQTRSLDKLMRLYFTMASVRAALSNCGAVPVEHRISAASPAKAEVRESSVTISVKKSGPGRFRRTFTQAAIARSQTFLLITSDH